MKDRFRLAPVFDHVDPVAGPTFALDRPVVSDARERTALLRRLDAGTTVLASPVLVDDVLDPSLGAVVPMDYRTDGVWIWTDAIAYYLRSYGLAPAAELRAHLAGPSNGVPRRPSREEAQAAFAFLLEPSDDEDAQVVWSVG
jgi:hypothetical protein